MEPTKRYWDGAATFKAMDDEAGVFEGYASVYGVVDSYGDRIRMGAFDDSLIQRSRDGEPLPILWQHDIFNPIGKFTSVETDDKGLKVRGKLTMSVPQAQIAHALMMDEVIYGMSIGGQVLKRSGVWINQLDLREISLVTVPALKRARIEDVRAEVTKSSPLEAYHQLRADGWSPADAQRLVSGIVTTEPAPAADAATSQDVRDFVATIKGV